MKTFYQNILVGSLLRGLLPTVFFLLSATNVEAKGLKRLGEIWPDTRGIHINAHGGGLLRVGRTWYWYGEHKSDTTSSAMVGVTCYSSRDLKRWTYRGVAMPVSHEKGSDIEQGCIIERPKVVYNAKTRKYVMWFHLELKDRGYSAARWAVAVADKPTGPFRYLRSGRACPGRMPQNLASLLPDSTYQRGIKMEWWTPEWRKLIEQGLFVQRDLEQGQMARDQTVYVDDDGKAWHIYSSEDNLTLHIAELTDDYTAHTGRYWRVAAGGQNEAPTIFKHQGTYWLITSGCTGWDPNEARMFHARSITGPWTQVPSPCQGPGANKTFGAQGTYIFKHKGQFVFMADIWRPKHPNDARYLWLPITFDEHGTPVIRL